MWAAYLVFLVISFVRAAKLPYCQELLLKGSGLRKDAATMVFTMDSTCVACYHEIQKLVRLKTQMARLGHNADIMVALNQLSPDHKHQLPSEITVDLEDAWNKLGQLNGHIFVFDKCGKLAYQVITPWSRQVYPFTAMAGLSALYDAPCGDCNMTSQAMDELQEVSESFAVGPEGNKLPLTITIRDHPERGNHVTYNMDKWSTQGPSGRTAHIDSKAEVKEPAPKITLIQKNGTSEGNQTAHGTESKSSSLSQPDEIDEPPDTKNTTSDFRNGATPRASTKKNHAETSTLPPASREYAELLKRYQPLMKWRTCANLVMSIQV